MFVDKPVHFFQVMRMQQIVVADQCNEFVFVYVFDPGPVLFHTERIVGRMKYDSLISQASDPLQCAIITVVIQHQQIKIFVRLR